MSVSEGMMNSEAEKLAANIDRMGWFFYDPDFKFGRGDGLDRGGES